jgi:response regulator RpfG family c-di-GMP phosphodiesterase
VLRRLKSAPATAEIPVVVLSSLSEKNRQRLLEAGAEEYLEKNALMPGKGVNLLPKSVGERDLPHQPQAQRRLFDDPLHE